MKAYKVIDGDEHFDYRYLYRGRLERMEHNNGFDVMRLSNFNYERNQFRKLVSERVVYDGDGFVITASGYDYKMYRVYSDEDIPKIYKRFMEVLTLVDALGEF